LKENNNSCLDSRIVQFFCWAWWYTHLIPNTQETETGGYRARPCLKQKKASRAAAAKKEQCIFIYLYIIINFIWLLVLLASSSFYHFIFAVF
jgi:hypothetical protein